MIPKSVPPRLSITMHFTDTNSQSSLWPGPQLALGKQPRKESQLKLSLETRNRGDIVIIHCHGRIVFRDEAVALSQLANEFIEYGGKVVLDLGGVSSIDSAGMGELVFLHTRAQAKNAEFKCAGPTPLVRELLDLTNLNTVLEIHPSVSEALAAFQPAEACLDC